MSWEDRIQDPAYTSPSGERFVFTYEDVSRETDKKTTPFTFPDKDGAFIQDLGAGGRRYPMRIFFWGEDYDIQADAFYLALEEKGAGKLEHPRYGTVNVVPTGKIRQRDDLKTAANQAVFEIEFWQTIIEITFPNAADEATNAVNEIITEYVADAPGVFDKVLDLVSSNEIVSFSNRITAGVAVVKNNLGKVANTVQGIGVQFNSLYTSITSNISDLVETPITLATDIIELIRLPNRAAASIETQIDSYVNIINTLLETDFSLSLDNQPENSFAGTDLVVQSAIIGLIEATTKNEFITKPDAINAADSILSISENSNNWADDNRENLELIDTGEIYQIVNNASIISAARLVEISFSLLQERFTIIDRPRTFVDLCAELYGELDPKYDFIINSNNLTGSEILELPLGKEIKYYV
ncbi:DNA circularization N-terminal domain-containing protein [Candidatus Pacearchaeota archaeon]|nr:DNA circularization N-terminal domain-containing protein [Candidatus Pacearchaeota archaeon]